jgi:hypothetical protein
MAGPGLTPRRGFLARLIAGVATLATAPGAVAGQSDPRQGTSARWDDSWTARVTGRHRAVFDIPEIKGGTVGLFRSGMWMDNYAEMYGVKDQDLSPVGQPVPETVLRPAGLRDRPPPDTGGHHPWMRRRIPADRQ